MPRTSLLRPPRHASLPYRLPRISAPISTFAMCFQNLRASDQMDDHELNARFTSALQRLVPDVAREWCEPECVLEHGFAADGILLLAQRVKADLIVLGTRKASHWFDNFKTGVAFQVISSSHCPVLTIRA